MTLHRDNNIECPWNDPETFCNPVLAGLECRCKEVYLLQNETAGYVGNSPVFWSRKGGYSQWIDDAKQWEESEAEQQILSCRGTHSFKMIPWSIVAKCAKQTVDIQDLRRKLDSDN